jgi:hypothetical protein
MTIIDTIAGALRKKAYETGKPLKEVVNRTLEAGLRAELALPPPRPHKIKPVSLGGAIPGVNLDKALRLSDQLEDFEIARKLGLRK